MQTVCCAAAADANPATLTFAAPLPCFLLTAEEDPEEDAADMEDAQDDEAAPDGMAQQQPQALQPRPAAEQQQRPRPATKQGKPAGRRVAFQSPAAEEEGDRAAAADAGTPQPQRGGADAGDAGSDGGTPYDGILAMLRQGPLAAASPRSFPRPRASNLTAGAGRTPGPGLVFGGVAAASPSPMPPSGGSELGGGARRVSYVGSRLGPAGGTATPSTGMRTTYAARSGSRFSRTPVHMQPLAAGVPGGSGGAGSGGAGGTSRFGLAAAAAAAAGGGESAGAGAGLLSPAPLAWTPMRSNLATGGRGGVAGGAVSGAKRKADSASPDAGAWVAVALLCREESRHWARAGARVGAHWPAPCKHLGSRAHTLGPAGADGDAAGNISLLDAQRRIRQKAEPLGGGGEATGDRRAWRAGRTPFHKGASGPSRFGAALQQPQERSASPGLTLAAAPAAAPAAAVGGTGSKATTDTARRILATLDALDKVVAASPPGGAAAAVAAALGEGQQEEAMAASPPPTDSLGFAGVSVGLRGPC